ncbi:MAG: carbonic anhydrase [Planctomycetota bacterium]|nr:carbonic anhydrase [Planctomycetota bacterium]MDA1113356.1 carbonic anhydrase [Planctomycetota bacterium]
MIPGTTAIQKLVDGNLRFVAGETHCEPWEVQAHREALVEGQKPFAVILGCSDSRVPTEVIFDQGLGALFVVRIAGNIAAPSQIGSIEYAVEFLGAQLVVVLGHTFCGAVAAAIAQNRGGLEIESPHLRSVVDEIRPVVDADSPADAVRANVRHSVQVLQSQSKVLASQMAQGNLQIVGAEYCLESGAVSFL